MRKYRSNQSMQFNKGKERECKYICIYVKSVFPEHISPSMAQSGSYLLIHSHSAFGWRLCRDLEQSFHVKVQGHIRPLYKIFAYILSPYLYLLNKKKHLWVKAKKYISKVIADVFEIQCWIIISLNLAQPYSNFTKRLPVVNRFEVMLDQGFRSIFRRSPWIIFVGRIFSLPLAQHCSEFT